MQLQPGATGADVVALDLALLERGVAVPETERAAQVYGPGTVVAVRDFQAKHGLVVDGIAGPRTWAALTTTADVIGQLVPKLDTSNLPPFVARLLEIADREYRRPTLEQPPGSNRGPDVDRYLLGHDGLGAYLLEAGRTETPARILADGRWGGAPWCGRFALWCVEEAAVQLKMALSPVLGWGDLASAAKWKEQGESHGRFGRRPSPGAIGCILTGGHGHVVIVADVDPEGSITTREGNSGQRVAARTRRVAEFAGFVVLG